MSSLHALVSKGHVHWHMASFKRKTRPSKTDPKTVIPPLPNRRCHHQLLPTLLSMSQKGRKARSIISNDQSQLYYSQPCQWRDHSAGIRNRIRGILEKTSDSLNTPRTDQNSNSYHSRWWCRWDCWTIAPVTFNWLQWDPPIPKLWCKWPLYASLTNLCMKCLFKAVLPQQIHWPQFIHHHFLLNSHHLCSHHHLLALKSQLVLSSGNYADSGIFSGLPGNIVVCQIRFVFMALYICIRTQYKLPHTHTHTQLHWSNLGPYFVQKFSTSMWLSYF